MVALVAVWSLDGKEHGARQTSWKASATVPGGGEDKSGPSMRWTRWDLVCGGWLSHRALSSDTEVSHPVEQRPEGNFSETGDT